MLELKAEKRELIGRKSRSLRKKGFLPAVIYGPKLKSASVSVEAKVFNSVWKKAGESTVVTLEVPEGQKISKHSVLIYDVAKEPLTGQPVHVDFYAVDITKAVTAEILLHFVGDPPAVKDLSGVLIKILHEIEVEALPMDLPHEIIVDTSVLRSFADKIFVKDIKVGPKVKILADAEEVVAIIEPPRSEEELSSLTQAPSETEAIESIKVTSEDKKKEVELEEGAEEKTGK